MQVGEWRQDRTGLVKTLAALANTRGGAETESSYSPATAHRTFTLRPSFFLLPTHLRHPTNSFANSPISHFCQIFLSQYSVRTVLSVVRPVNFESHDLHIKNNKHNTTPTLNQHRPSHFHQTFKKFV
jgi:hypothetical protein